MLVRLDARTLTDPDGLIDALAEAFGFAAGFGRNLDALVDCLTQLDDPRSPATRVRLFPGQTALLVLEHMDGLGKQQSARAKVLADVAAFVNWRRLEKGQPPVLAVAYAAP